MKNINKITSIFLSLIMIICIFTSCKKSTEEIIVGYWLLTEDTNYSHLMNRDDFKFIYQFTKDGNFNVYFKWGEEYSFKWGDDLLYTLENDKMNALSCNYKINDNILTLTNIDDNISSLFYEAYNGKQGSSTESFNINIEGDTMTIMKRSEDGYVRIQTLTRTTIDQVGVYEQIP